MVWGAMLKEPIGNPLDEDGVFSEDRWFGIERSHTAEHPDRRIVCAEYGPEGMERIGDILCSQGFARFGFGACRCGEGLKVFRGKEGEFREGGGRVKSQKMRIVFEKRLGRSGENGERAKVWNVEFGGDWDVDRIRENGRYVGILECESRFGEQEFEVAVDAGAFGLGVTGDGVVSAFDPFACGGV